jgi:adenylate cyclase
MATVRTQTVLKTDLQGFSGHVEGLTSSELESFLRRHRDLIAGAIRAGGGNIIKELGDSDLATFESSTAALLAAIDIQRQAAAQSMDARLGVRVMLAAGDIILQDGDAFGTAVNIVSRLEAVTPVGEIYFTESVYQLCNRAEIASEPVETFVLKGIADPVRVHRTTYRHQTRELHDATVLFTDLCGFTKFALAAELRAVEDLLHAWATAHEQASAQHQGVVRDQLGDGFLLTFSSAANALHCWMDLSAHAAELFATLPKPFTLGLGAGMSSGTIRVFKSAIYGLALNEAAHCQSLSRTVGQRYLIAPGRAIATLSADDRALVDVAPFPMPESAPRDESGAHWLPPLVAISRRASSGR